MPPAIEGNSRRATVALVACDDYERAAVEDAVSRCFELLGGPMSVMPDEGGRVLLKPNMLLAVPPKLAVTTHPEVLRATIRCINDRAGEIVVGDCPMFARPVTALKRCGLLEVMDEYEVEPAETDSTATIHGRDERLFSHFEVIKPCTEADLLINIFKLKTHGMSGLTLAIKNLFGLIPGLEKSKWHLKAASHAEFNEMLVDLVEAVHLSYEARGARILHICDGVIGLDGDGPGPAGTLRKIGVIAASTDAVALETVLAKLVGFEADDVLTIPIAAARGLGVDDLAAIDVVGDDLERLAMAPGEFEPNRGSVRSGAAFNRWPFNAKFVRDRLVETPQIDHERCTGCGECRKVCAAKAITLSSKPKKADIDGKICIRCYCCVEVCQYEAARLGPRPLLARIADRSHLLPWIGAGLGVVALASTVAYFVLG